jgi:hypothetical protein
VVDLSFVICAGLFRQRSGRLRRPTVARFVHFVIFVSFVV